VPGEFTGARGVKTGPGQRVFRVGPLFLGPTSSQGAQSKKGALKKGPCFCVDLPPAGENLWGGSPRGCFEKRAKRGVSAEISGAATLRGGNLYTPPGEKGSSALPDI